MDNIVDFPSDDFDYITGSFNEPDIVGVRCENISIQLAVDLHNVMLGDIEIKREELIAFIIATDIHNDFVKELK